MNAEEATRRRLAAILVEGVFFAGVLPLALTSAGRWLDAWLRLPTCPFTRVRLVAGGLLAAAGFLFALWTVYVQFTWGKGTPAPMMPTQKLIVEGPYRYCRNPMILGTMGFYLGLAIVVGSISAGGLVLLAAAAMFAYIKRVEEKELEARFGDAYCRYRDSTPFIIPRLRKDIDQNRPT